MLTNSNFTRTLALLTFHLFTVSVCLADPPDTTTMSSERTTSMRGRDVGNGGEAVMTNARPRLRDLVDGTNCVPIRGTDFATRFNPVAQILSNIRQVHWYVADYLERDLNGLRFCLTQSRLYPVSAHDDDYDSVTIFERNTRQLMVRLDNVVYVDMRLFNALPMLDKAYGIIHETVHSIFPQNTAQRNYKVRNLVAALKRASDAINRGRNIDEVRIQFGDLITAVRMDLAPNTIPLNPYRRALTTAFSSNVERERMQAAHDARSIQPLLLWKDRETFHHLLNALPTHANYWVQDAIDRNDEINAIRALQYSADPNLMIDVRVPNQTEFERMPLISYAIRFSKHNLLEALLNHPRLRPADNVLIDAAATRNLGLVERLLRFNLNPNATRADGATALILAVQNDDENMAQLFLDRLAQSSQSARRELREGSAYPNGPLQIAVENNNINIIRLLINARLDLGLDSIGQFNFDSQQNPYWLVTPSTNRVTATPLWLSVARNNVSAAQMLLEAGANPNATDSHGISPLQVATYLGNTEMVRLLLSNAATRTDVGVTITADQDRNFGRICWSSFWMGSGCDSAPSWTPMMVAIERNHADIVRLLIHDQRSNNRSLLDSPPPSPVSVHCSLHYRSPECAPPLHIYMTQTGPLERPEYGPSRRDWTLAEWATFRGRAHLTTILQQQAR